MPARLTRKAMGVIDEHANSIIFGLFAIMLITAIFAASGWMQARDAQRRLATVEGERQAEQRAADVQKVASCFATQRNRPRLILILTAIAANLDDQFARDAIHELVEDYDDDTPSRADCLQMADDLGVDARPFDLPPPG